MIEKGSDVKFVGITVSSRFRSYRIKTIVSIIIPPTQSPATPSPPVSYECTHQGYSLYLSHYSLKCSSDCDQYME